MNANQATQATEAVRPSSDGSRTVEATEIDGASAPDNQQGPPTLRLRLKPEKERRKVQWTSETVDNEHLGRKKSKCCCVFVKKRPFGQSDSEDSDEGDCDHCSGHTPSDPKK